jgi:hypothetical protein
MNAKGMTKQHDDKHRQTTDKHLASLPLVCFCHHKCASQYVRGVFQSVARWLGLTFQVVVVADHPDTAPDAAGSRKVLRIKKEGYEEPTADVLYFGNANAVTVDLLIARGGYRGFHVIRDPRDILISGYFSHRYSHKIQDEWGERLAEHRRRLEAQPSIAEGLLLELDFAAGNFANITGWRYDDPNVYETRYEALTADPWANFLEAFQFLGLTAPRWGLPSLAGMAADASIYRLFRRPMPRRACLPQPLLHRILAQHAFERRAGGRTRGQEDERHHYRKGIAGDWRNYFTPQVTAEFKARHGDLLIRLGYESAQDW